MKTGLLHIQLMVFVFACQGSILSAAEPFKPNVYEAERYRHIWEKSPFVTETPVVQKSDGLAQRFILTGAATLQDQPVIFVLDRTKLARFMVTMEPNQDGLSLVSILNEADPKQAQATIRLGAEQAVIRYDLAALSSVNKASNPQASRSPESSPVASAPTNRPKTAPVPTRTIRRIKPIKLDN